MRPAVFGDISDEESVSCVDAYKTDHLKQASILNSKSLQKLYFAHEYKEREQNAFAHLLKNGSIIVFLYDDHELTLIGWAAEYTVRHAVMNGTGCMRIAMYCIREKLGDAGRCNTVRNS